MKNKQHTRKTAKFPKTAPGITDEGVEFTSCLCDECGGNTFHIGIFNGQFKFQCVRCYPTADRTVH